MELEEMKNTWGKLSKRVEKQEILTTQLIEKITQQNYNSKMNKIHYSEYVGTIICYVGASYILMNFSKIDEVLIQVLAGLSVLLLFTLPVISLKSVRSIRNIDITSNTYLENINLFVRQKIKFQKLQKLNVALGLFFMLIVLPVLAAIQGKSLDQIPDFWTLIFPIFVSFFLVFAWWVLKSYNKVLSATEKMLTDINN
ncbi:hypothetical protein LX77_01718 [Gelidibacter algens]|uniref:Uncharacterized protein n=1 Tax=Gelidibacter algens TaxID=49280 RepID=A0A1A7R1M6_9FLAO|nr:hypothetical protein [Gelidibacter algens]OBX25384.1 hypothetical protein A9996_10025 [Gelidibacter algens]RAJ24722.1 hypothetical protein LX77_01718 [Gelidibacter algens]